MSWHSGASIGEAASTVAKYTQHEADIRRRLSKASRLIYHRCDCFAGIRHTRKPVKDDSPCCNHLPLHPKSPSTGRFAFFLFVLRSGSIQDCTMSASAHRFQIQATYPARSRLSAVSSSNVRMLLRL